MLGLQEVLETIWGRPARPAERERLRRRALACAGFCLFLGGLVAALGFGSLVLDAAAALAVVACVVGALLGLRLVRAGRLFRVALGRIGPTILGARAPLRKLEPQRRLSRAANRAGASSRPALGALGRESAKARSAGVVAGGLALRRAKAGLRRASRLGAKTLEEAGMRARAASQARKAREPSRPPAGAPSIDPQRQVLQLNTLGAKLRREGKHERAAAQHRAALKLVRDLGDERTEALTLNNLALAVVHTEGIDSAVEHFEQALVVLRQLGDEEHEGRVIANLGFIHRSHGRSEEAEPLLHAALGKLPADSTAYRRVEEQLRRAS
ncbi:MAG: tetratricopeptide repeat protein [Gaiellaceae bacterium]